MAEFFIKPIRAEEFFSEFRDEKLGAASYGICIKMRCAKFERDTSMFGHIFTPETARKVPHAAALPQTILFTSFLRNFRCFCMFQRMYKGKICKYIHEHICICKYLLIYHCVYIYMYINIFICTCISINMFVIHI